MELIVVIFIVSIIAGVFVSIYYTVTNSKLAEYTREEMDDIESALLDFYQDLGQFPKDTNDLAVDFLDLERDPSTTDRYYGSTDLKTWRLNHWNGPYIQDKFEDEGYMQDAWGNYYIYDYTYGDNYCTVTSYGPDGESGGDDDIEYTISAVEIDEEKKENVQDELDIIQKALTDYIRATGENPSSIDDLFEWEVLNLHMDESSWSGTSGEVKDYSGDGNHGTANGGATTTAGKVGNAGNFDGVDDYVDCGNVTEFNSSNPFSMSVWIKTTQSTDGQIVDRGVSHVAELQLESSGQVHFWVEDASDADKYVKTNVVNDGEWHHIVGVYDGTYIKVYQDGILIQSLDITGFSIYYNSADHVYIGYGDTGYFSGTIDEVRIYTVALSEEEIYRHYENPGYPRSYFDLHDDAYKYDEWETEYKFRTATVSGTTYNFFYSCGPDLEDDLGKDDDILPRGLEWLKSSL